MKSPKLRALGLLGLAVGVVASCSAVSGSGNQVRGNGGSAASTTGTGGSAGIALGTGGSLSLIDGGPEGDAALPLPDSGVPPESLVDWPQNADCWPKVDG